LLADRINKLNVSPTMKIAAKAISMKAEGYDIIDFSVGEPDLPTPDHIKDAARKALDINYTKYTMNAGSIELRKAIAKKLKDENGLDYKLNEIIVSNGAKQAIYNAIMTLVDEGDEVIIPAPFYVSYPEMVNLAKGKSVVVNTKEENGFKITPAELREAITSNTKVFILCNPCNPTGTAYNETELKALADVLEDEEIYILSDEIYEKLVYDDFKFTSFASLGEKIKAKTVIVNGVSKAFSMTGWRIGYAAAVKEIIEGCNKVQSHSTSGACSISQMASDCALLGSKDFTINMVKEFQRRRDYVLSRLKEIPGITCHKPEGAFYVFPNISSYFDKEYNGTYVRNSYGLANYLLREGKVVVVPGEAFGGDNYIRISYTTSMANLKEGIDRIISALSKLESPVKSKIFDLSNAKTRIKRPIELETSINIETRNALVAEAEVQLKYDNYFEWNANINNVVVQLRTNVPHLYDFWIENWYPAQLKPELKPDGIIYAAFGVIGREPHAFYNPETNTGILFNTDNYGSLRSLAFGLVADIANKKYEMNSIRGMSADYKGNGFVLVGPKGAKKTEIFYGLLKNDDITFHSTDIMFVSLNDKKILAENPERKIYIPTFTSAAFPTLADLFYRSKCENVISKASECETRDCQQPNGCDMDSGYPYCFKASKDSYAMLDPYWIGGMYKHLKEINIRTIFIMKSDSGNDQIRQLDSNEAVSILEKGWSSGLLTPSDHKTLPFYNLHFVVNTPEKIEAYKTFYREVFKKSKCYLVNVEKGTEEEIQKSILDVIN